MDDSNEIKKTLANFLGFTLSKSREIEQAIVPGSAVSKSGNNIDYIAAKAAAEIDKTVRVESNSFQVPSPAVDIAQQLIPDLSYSDIHTVPVSENVNANILTSAKEPSEAKSLNVDEQLEFNFTEPNNQTKLILSEINFLNQKLNKILDLLQNKTSKRSQKNK